MPDARIERIKKIEVPVLVRLGSRQMPLRDVIALIPGSIIELPKQSDEELDLVVANKTIGSGEAVKVGENFGLRIGYIGDLRERLEALKAGGQSKGGKDEAESDSEDEAAALAAAMLAGQ